MLQVAFAETFTVRAIRAMSDLEAFALTLVLLSPSAHAQTNAVAARIDRILREVPPVDGTTLMVIASPHSREDRVAAEPA